MVGTKGGKLSILNCAFLIKRICSRDMASFAYHDTDIRESVDSLCRDGADARIA